jgi:predicted nucleic acid-binding protein
MSSFLLDTNVIVDALRRRKDRHLLVESLLLQGQPLASCPVTVTEIYAGMRPHEEGPTRAFMDSLLFLPVTKEIAERAGYLKAFYTKRGKSLSFQDATIAAIAIAHGCTLVTENVKDFPMPDVRMYSFLQA